MTDPNSRSVGSPLDRLDAIREWLWRHSSQPNGDPWDSDPEHLDRAARNLLDDLVQSFPGTAPSPSATGRTRGLPPASSDGRSNELLSSGEIRK